MPGLAGIAGAQHPLREVGIDFEMLKRALRAAKALRYGTVWINDHLTIVSEMPHGGFGQSGYGKDMSSYSIEDYTIIKHVMAKIAD